MNCPNCSLPIDPGATYCGNCGQLVGKVAAQTTAVPGYALTVPAQEAGEVKALFSLVLGVAGIIGSVFMALFGLVLGLAGIILGTLSRSSRLRRVSTAGLVFSGLAILAGLGVWVRAAAHDPRLQNKAPPVIQAPSVTSLASSLSTPCYSIGFADLLRISHTSGSCDVKVFNGQSLESSTDVYKIYANQSHVTSVSGFNVLAKHALEEDVKANLPGFTIDDESAGSFAGAPAYLIHLTDSADKVSLVEAAVLHQAPTGANVFILVHATNSPKTDLQILESQWQWK